MEEWYLNQQDRRSYSLYQDREREREREIARGKLVHPVEPQRERDSDMSCTVEGGDETEDGEHGG